MIFALPLFAGFLGRRYLHPLANFCLMMAIFQLDLLLLRYTESGQFAPRLLLPYTVVAVLPAAAGLIGKRFLGTPANGCLIAATFYLASVLLAFYSSGEFRPVLFFQGIFVSAGSLVPPFVFSVIALLGSREQTRNIG